MNDFILIEPDVSYINQIQAYRQAFLDYNDSMDGTSQLRAYEDIAAWLAHLENEKHKETCNPKWVPDLQYIYVRKSDNKIVGMIDIRLELNRICFDYFGGIGYSIHPLERRKGYATAMLKEALKICRQHNMKKVLVCCYKSNVASAKTIIKNGGILENEVSEPQEAELTQRYWITL